MISELAVVHPEAKIGTNVTIGPFSVIGKDVEIGDNTIIESHVVIKGPTLIGKNNHFFQFCSIGEAPQDKKYAGEPTTLRIGDENIIREFVTISRGTVQDHGETFVGNRNLLMAYVHIAHDCHVGSDTVFSNNASIAGHVRVGDKANLGGFVGVHQFCHIGSYSFCAGGSIITKDVAPFVMVSGHPAQVHGLNQVGLRRRGFSEESIAALKQAYKIFFRQGHTAEEALGLIKDKYASINEVSDFIDSVETSERGILR
ncbi:MAG: acyl-[acyl-carrier-protein]--UDP-N-acetylglucosamine O-acyltransferase [Legionellales bacterium]|nr:acyl-[acyl-carrier-protein]--UDP-N-acetylglucosamine O-acyltransferase [Legionellales bacterium]